MNNKIKKNIVLVVPSLAREGGIILSFIISRYLINKGFDITIVNLNQNCLDMIDDFKSLKAHVINLNLKKGFYRYINLTFSIYRISKRYKPNAILSILFGWHLFISIGGKLAKVNKVIVHVGNLAPYWERNFWKFKLLVRLAEPFTDKLICCSKFIKDTTIEHFGVSSKHTRLIYNSIDPKFLERLPKRDPKKIRDFNIGIIGRLDFNRDYETLISAISELNKKKYPIHFTIVGDGKAFEFFKNKIESLNIDKITTMTGRLSNIPKVLQKIDIYAWPSLYREGFGIALLEAICSGIPCIVSDTPSNRELLNDNYVEFFIPKNINSMVKGITNIMGNYEIAINNTKKIRKEIISKFSSEEMCEKYIEEMLN